MKKALFALLGLALSFPITTLANPSFDAEGFRQALKVKKDVYITEGAFTGGDRLSSDFHITNIRMAPNPAGYDRIVIDLTGNDQGEKSELARPPFYLVSVNRVTKEINVTLYGLPKIDFSSQSVIQAARKTRSVSEVEFVPSVVEDRWLWTIKTEVPVKVEVFELTSPARIIIDLKK